MATPTTAPAPSSPSPAPAPPARRRRTRAYLGAIGVVAVGIALVVFVVLPGLTGSGKPPAVLTYSGARPVADRAVSGFQGGGWTLLFAAGLVSPTNESLPVNASTLGSFSGCSYTLNSAVHVFTLPGFTGNRSSGQSPAWEFVYRNGTDALAIVSVVNGSATVLATVTGETCSFYAGLVLGVPGSVIDSSRAAAAVESRAATFLASYPTASAAYVLFGGLPPILGGTGTPEWTVVYSTCSVTSSANGTGSVFNATVNALTGAVLTTHTNASASCGGTFAAAGQDPGTPGAHPLALAPDREGALARP